MKSQQIVVTSGNSPFTFPLNERGGPRGVAATPAGAGNYTIEYTLTAQNEEPALTSNPIPITEMTAETGIVAVEIGPATAIIITLNSGTSVTVDVTQSDV